MSNHTNVIYQHDSYSDDDEKSPPPPPPPPSPTYEYTPTSSCSSVSISMKSTSESFSSSKNQSTTTRTTITRRKRSKNLEVAKQFHTFVLQMKCFCGWNEYIILRKHVIQSKKNILKRILLKWSAYVEEVQMKKRSTTILIQMMEVVRRIAIKSSFERICFYSKDIALIEKIFEIWRDYSYIEKKDRMMRQSNLISIISIQRVGQCFYGWRSQGLVENRVRCKRQTFLSKLLKGWNDVAKSSSYTRRMKLHQALILIDENKNEFKKKIFRVLVSCITSVSHFIRRITSRALMYFIVTKRSYSAKKKRYRRSLYQFINKRAQSLVVKAFRSFIVFCTNRRQQRKYLKRILLKQILKQWKLLNDRSKLRENVFLQIILNRWRTLVDDRKERREKTTLAMKHWADRRRERILTEWFMYANERKGSGLRTPPRSSQSKMRSINYEFARGENLFDNHRYHEFSYRQRFGLNRPWNSMPRSSIPRRDFQSSSHDIMNNLFSQPSRVSTTRERIPMEDSMLNSLQQKHSSADSFSTLLNKHNHRRHTSGHSLFGSSKRDDIPHRKQVFHTSFSNDRLPHNQRTPIEELMMMGPPDKKENHTINGKSNYIPSWILRDLSHRRSCNEGTSRKTHEIPQDSFDVLPKAEPKQWHLNSHQLKQTNHLSRRSSNHAAKCVGNDGRKEMKDMIASHMQNSFNDFKESKSHK